MAIASTLGGYAGGRVAPRVRADWLWGGIVAVGATMSVLFFLR